MDSHTLLNWKLTFIDVKDAFLLVDQVKLVLVEKPLWWKPEELEMMAKGQKRFWTLLKCLPGQRDAAARWYGHLSHHLGDLASPIILVFLLCSATRTSLWEQSVTWMT